MIVCSSLFVMKTHCVIMNYSINYSPHDNSLTYILIVALRPDEAPLGVNIGLILFLHRVSISGARLGSASNRLLIGHIKILSIASVVIMLVNGVF